MYGIRQEPPQPSQPPQPSHPPPAAAVVAPAAAAAAGGNVTAAAAAAALPGGSCRVNPTVQQQKHNNCDRGGAAPQPAAQPPQPPQPQPPQPPQRAPESLLPPENFSQPAQAAPASYGFIPDDGTDDDAAVQQPYVLHRAVKVQGRVAVAVPAAGSTGSTAVGAGGAGLRVSGGQVPLPLPAGDVLSRASSGSGGPGGGAVGRGSRMGSAGSQGGGGTEGLGYGRPGSARLAFALNGKLYDARGNELDPAAVGAVGPAAAVGAVGAVGGGGGVVVVDCGEAPPRLSR